MRVAGPSGRAMPACPLLSLGLSNSSAKAAPSAFARRHPRITPGLGRVSYGEALAASCSILNSVPNWRYRSAIQWRALGIVMDAAGCMKEAEKCERLAGECGTAIARAFLKDAAAHWRQRALEAGYKQPRHRLRQTSGVPPSWCGFVSPKIVDHHSSAMPSSITCANA